jgi:urease accessory protein
MPRKLNLSSFINLGPVYNNYLIIWLFFFLAMIFIPSSALAHITEDTSGGLISGMMHPISGMDHVVAMVAVGLWGAQLGMPAIWLLPVVFPLVMAMGGVLGLIGIPLPAVELGIALSAIVLGLMVALAQRPPLAVSAILVGIFAIFHGYAHGAELPASAGPLAFSVGFVFATGCLHATGILIGLIIKWPLGAKIIRVGGGAIAATGVYFLAGIFM